jgi:hypothetical protein
MSDIFVTGNISSSNVTGDLTGINVSAILSYGCSQDYVDRADNLRLKEASLGPQFYWEDGSLFIADVSGETSEVTKLYVDGSLAERDASIVALRLVNNAQDASIGILNVAITNLETSVAYLDIYTQDLSTKIGSTSNWKPYVDGSLAAMDVSITVLFNENDTLDSSIVALRSVNAAQDASIAVLRAVNTAQDDSIVRLDGSINYLWNWDLAKDASIVTLRSVNTSQDASIIVLRTVNTSQDASICLINTDITYIQTSLGVHNGLINTNIANIDYLETSVAYLDVYVQDLSTRIAPSEDWKTYVDGSLSLRDASITLLFKENDTQDASIVLINTGISNFETSLGTLNGLINTNITDISNIETSLGTLNNRNVSQDASIVLINADITNIETSLGTLNGLINTNISDITNIETSVAYLDVYNQDLSTRIGSIDDWQEYVDGSLSARDLSINNLYSRPIADVTKLYVDGSLSTRDSSISEIFENIEIQDVSISKLIYENPRMAFQTLTIATSDSSVLWLIRNGYNAKVILTRDVSLFIPDVSNGDSGTLMVIQDGSGSRLMKLPSGSRVMSDASTLSTSPSAIDFISFIYDVSTFYWNIGKNYVTR